MRFLGKRAGGIWGVFALLGLLGCEDRLPTAIGADRFPEGVVPTTVELLLPADAFVLAEAVFDGFADPRDAPFLLVANEFDGVLDAHALARLTGFPDSVTFTADGTARTDTAFTFGTGRVVATVNESASFATGPTTLRLFALEQPWDTATVGWDFAAAGPGEVAPWRVPGGTPGTLLGEAVFIPGDTATADSLVWQVDSLAVERISRPGFAGLLVTSANPGSRVQLSRLVLETTVRPASKPDTALARTIAAGPQTFVFTPPPPEAPGVYRIGGLTEARTVLRLDLDRSVPACADPATTPACPLVPLRDVTLNQASLVVNPVPVPAGFRPLTPSPVRVRRVLEPELGRLAPLGPTLAVDTLAPALFQGTANPPVSLDVTEAVRQLTQQDEPVTLALLGPPGASQFGFVWLAGRPFLRLVYTLPLRPRLP